MVERRNPYLILGIPYGATRGEARRAAANRARELRHREDSPFTTEDVTWALHQVEQVIDDASSAVDVFRIPAAPGILDAPTGDGLFHPPDVPMARQSPPLSGEEHQEIRRRAVMSVASKVLQELGPQIRCWPPTTSERNK